MGVTIHYRGNLNDISKIQVLCDELAMIADKMDWRYTRLDEDWSKPLDACFEYKDNKAEIKGHLPLKGISFSIHPRCESLQFFFDSEGNLCNPVSMVLISEGTLKPEDAWIAVKTQFSGPETHMWVISLLKYLKEHYIADLEVHDEGEFWETGDSDILKKKMAFLNEKMDALADTLSQVNGSHLDKFSAEELASVIETLVQNKLQDEEPEEGN